MRQATATADRSSVWLTWRDTQFWKQHLLAAAAAWRLPPGLVVALMLLPLVVAIAGGGTALISKDLYKWVTGEDGLAETAQVVFYTLALVFALLLTPRWSSRVLTGLYLVASLGLFFLIGEELSWGQRIFGWRTAESLAAINKQGETNLHNIYGVGSTFKWIQLLVGAYGAVLPLALLYWRLPQRLTRLAAAVVPHYSLVPYFLPLFVWRAYRNLVEVPGQYYFAVAEYNEVLELVLSLGLFLFMVFHLRRLRSSRAAA